MPTKATTSTDPLQKLNGEHQEPRINIIDHNYNNNNNNNYNNNNNFMIVGNGNIISKLNNNNKYEKHSNMKQS